ncbi:MAG: translation initiation factor IF-2 [Candidatus Paceibacterota bacterium]
MKSHIEKENTLIERPPVVVIMGHIDHGKSTLLDYIRKSNIVEKEAGGITQHLSAYEVVHKNDVGIDKKITFLDTPGHEAFSKMRERGAQTADIAILVVSAEDSVKAQTVEALNTILESKIPYIVAINKIDKPGANIEKVKNDLVEKGVYIEGYGGSIPYALISAKTGEGVDNLLSLILLSAELEEFKGNPALPATGIVIESNLDTKRGMTATLVIKDGTLEKGMFVVAGTAIVGTRMVENFLGKPITSATFSSPIRLIGFDVAPSVGSIFTSYSNKKDAEQVVRENKEINQTPQNSINQTNDNEIKYIPIVIKTDVYGTAEAIEKEVGKLSAEGITFKIINKGVGAIGESDIKMASADKDSIIVGFNVKMESGARDLNEKMGVSVQTFDIIYKLTDFLKEEMEKRRPRTETAEVTGKAKIIKIFSSTKDKYVIGGRVTEGRIVDGSTVRIMRRDFEIGKAKIIELQQGKIKTREVLEENEFGMMIESKLEIAPGDVIEAFIMVTK